MRRALFILLALALGSVLLSAAGCPAAHDSYPTTACKTDKDCYKGEQCVANVCMTPQPDMAIDMSHYQFDFAHPDLTPNDAADGGDM